MTTYGRQSPSTTLASKAVRPLAEQTEANYDAVMNINVRRVALDKCRSRMLENGGGAL
jgi:hypothetical protein